jgi:ribonuclease-3
MLTSKPNIEAVQKKLQYIFKKEELLIEALTHKSYYHENKEKAFLYNERLEFLGDSVISLIIVEYLFLLQQKYAESVLAKIKSFLVSESVLADIASSISLGKYLLLGKGEETTGGRDKQSILSDALEAIIGAVYLDSGYEKTRKVLLLLFKEKLENVIKSGDFYDYKTELQEKSQFLYGILPEYRVIKQQGEEHKRIFTVAVFINGEKLGVASGKRKKEAETLAAQKALDKIN